MDAFGKILLGRNTQAVFYHIDIGDGDARLHAIHGLHGRVPIAEAVDGHQPGAAIAVMHPIAKVVAALARAFRDLHFRGEFRADRAVVAPGHAPAATAVAPVEPAVAPERIDEQLAERGPAGMSGAAVE